MLSLPCNDFPHPADQTQQLTISRIEVFIIPALAIDASGYRVCLRLTSDLGYSWSEQFIGENDRRLELDQWKLILRTFIGRFPLATLTERLIGCSTSPAEPDNRPFQMFASALHGVKQAAGAVISSVNPVEESVLQQRATAYLSID